MRIIPVVRHTRASERDRDRLRAVNAALVEALRDVIDMAATHAINERIALDHSTNAEYLDLLDEQVAKARAALARAEKGDKP